jgi:nitrate reductase NapA
MQDVDRRTFLLEMAALSAAGAGTVLAPRLLLASQRPAESPAPPVWKKTPCRLCGVGCGLLVAIENGRAVAVRGDPQSPVSAGLACAKGYYSVQALYGRDRITRALMRRQGTLAPAPMRDALDAVAARIRETIAKHGKDSVAVYGSAQWTIPDAYVAAKLFKGGLGTNNVETSARLYGAAAAAGLRTSFGLDGAIGCYEDIDHADVYVLWDVNLAETDPVLFSRMLERRRKDNAVLIIDVATRTTRTSYAADHSLLHAPRTGLALANAICREIVSRGLAHRDFVDHHVGFRRGRTDIGHGLPGEPVVPDGGVDVEWDDYVAFLSDYTAQRAQQLSGVPSERIRWLATVYADRSRRVMSVWGGDASQHSRGTWMNNVLHNIHLLVGKVASPGNAPFCVGAGPSGGSAVHDAGAATDALPRGTVMNADDRRRAASIWGVPVERIAARGTHTALEMFRALERGDIRFLWIQATNPMVSLPNLSRFRRAAAGEERFLVVSEAYPTPTTDVADVVLPSAMWLEREGVFANGERRLQHFDAMLSPPGDAVPDAWQLMEVARRLGHGALFPWNRHDYVAGVWEEYRRFHDDPRSALPTLDDLRGRPGVLWPAPSGREVRWRYNTSHDPAANRARGAFDFYGHPDGRARIWLRPHQAPAETPDAAYPFWLVTGPVLEHWGGGAMTQRVPTLHRAVPGAYVEIHRDDARRLGIRDRDMVRVSSRRGSLQLQARIDYRSQPQPGQLFVPSFDETLPVRRLLLDAACPLSGQPETTTCAARVERAERSP